MQQEFERDWTADLDAVRREVDAKGYAVITPPNLGRVCELARQEYLGTLETSPIQPPRRAFSYPDLAERPWRKLAISSTNGIGEPYAQFLQTTYFDHQRSPYPHLNLLFKLAIVLRNKLMGIAVDFAEDPIRDGFWNASRVHHYPSGGGFMILHRDTFFPAALGQRSFYQLLIPLSVKGRDFESGGGVVVDKSGIKRNTDDLPGMGSVLVYDGRTLHGVEDVDPDRIVSFDSPRGRLALISNSYCVKVPTRLDSPACAGEGLG